MSGTSLGWTANGTVSLIVAAVRAASAGYLHGRLRCSSKISRRVYEETATVTPDIAFQQCANAAAAAWNSKPAFVSYHVATHVSIPSLKRERDIVRSVQANTSNDKALVQDLPKGRAQITHAFPILPTFDAIGYFRLTGTASLHNTLESYVDDIHPLTYDMTKPPDDADPAEKAPDVVVVRLRAYRVTYASDSSDAPDGRTHLTLQPYKFVTDKGGEDNFFFDDIVVDNRTHLPTHVGFSGPDGLAFVVDYTTVDGQWVVGHAHYEQTQFAPMRLGRVHAIIDATFDQFTFPSAAPDPRIAS